MFSRLLSSGLIWRRSFSVTCVRAKDPCYDAFVEKVREYRLKSPDGKPVDPTPEYHEELKQALEKLAQNYGGGKDVDLLKFPKFQVPDIEIDPISIKHLIEKEKKAKAERESKEKKDKKDDKGKKGDKKNKDKDKKK